MRLAADVAFLKSQSINVERFNLGQQTDAFLKEPLVIETMGPAAQNLSLFLVDGEVKASGRYPDRAEFAGSVVNRSLSLTGTVEPVLQAKAAAESGPVQEVLSLDLPVVVLPWEVSAGALPRQRDLDPGVKARSATFAS